MNKLLGCLILGMGVLSASCTVTPYQESTGQYIDSTAITTKVKATLIDVLGAKGLAIVVKTFKDEVQLSGFVDNNAIKQRAGTAAASVIGVKRVRNDIIVK